MSDAFIVCSDLSFSWPDDTPVFQDLSIAVGGGRTGLVAPSAPARSWTGSASPTSRSPGACTP
jgi:hypothetical protein